MIGDRALERGKSEEDEGIRRKELTLYVRSFFFWTCQQLETCRLFHALLDSIRIEYLDIFATFTRRRLVSFRLSSSMC